MQCMNHQATSDASGIAAEVKDLKLEAGHGSSHFGSKGPHYRNDRSLSPPYLMDNEVMNNAHVPFIMDKSTRCRASQFYCQWDDRCLNMIRRCNGHSDCTNGEDEKDCDLFHKRMAPLSESEVIIPTAAALRSFAAAKSSPTQKLKRQYEFTTRSTTTSTTTSTAAPAPAPVRLDRHGEEDGPRLVPVYEWNAPSAVVHEPEAKAATTTTTSTPAPAPWDYLAAQRTMLQSRWKNYNKGRFTTPAAAIVTTEDPDLGPKTTLAFDRSYPRLPVPEFVPKQQVKEESSGDSVAVTAGVQKLRCQCTCSPSLF